MFSRPGIRYIPGYRLKMVAFIARREFRIPASGISRFFTIGSPSVPKMIRNLEEERGVKN